MNTVERMELLVILNATVVEDRDDLRELGRAFRKRMHYIYRGSEDDQLPPSALPEGDAPVADQQKATEL